MADLLGLTALLGVACAVLLCVHRWPAARLLLMLLGYLVVFGLGIGNFGTCIRHRAKFLVLFVVLAAPWLPRVHKQLSALWRIPQPVT